MRYRGHTVLVMLLVGLLGGCGQTAKTNKQRKNEQFQPFTRTCVAARFDRAGFELQDVFGKVADERIGVAEMVPASDEIQVTVEVLSDPIHAKELANGLRRTQSKRSVAQQGNVVVTLAPDEEKRVRLILREVKAYC